MSCRQYFQMRRNRLGKEAWVNIKWQPGKITHTFQKDNTSCGIFVVQVTLCNLVMIDKTLCCFTAYTQYICCFAIHTDG